MSVSPLQESYHEGTPFFFGGAMVRALLGGRNTQTGRVTAAPTPTVGSSSPAWMMFTGRWLQFVPSYGIGDGAQENKKPGEAALGAYSGDRDRSFRLNVTAAHKMVLRD
jgi:hypothetical protein